MQENDIIILSTDGMTDNLWDEDVIQQVIRFTSTLQLSPSVPSTYPKQPLSSVRAALLPITLSHALCTKAKSVAENGPPITEDELPEIPFGRRAKEVGHSFVGGKQDGKLRFPIPPYYWSHGCVPSRLPSLRRPAPWRVGRINISRLLYPPASRLLSKTADLLSRFGRYYGGRSRYLQGPIAHLPLCVHVPN